MIRELGLNNAVDWNENISIQLSMSDLQIIYDCVGAVPLKYLNAKHKNNTFFNKINANMFSEIYNNLDDIISRHNGFTDDTLDVNINIELDMIGEENE